MQASGNFIAVSAKLGASVERGHNCLQSGDFRLLVNVYRDAAAVIGNAYEIFRQQRNLNIVRMLAHRLVTRVVKDFPDEVVEAIHACSPDVHSRAFSDRVKPLQNRDGRGAIRARRSLAVSVRSFMRSRGGGGAGRTFLLLFWCFRHENNKKIPFRGTSILP